METKPVNKAARKELVTPEHLKVRRILCVAGPVTLGLGVTLLAIALIDFFLSFNDTSRGFPKLFWCAFLGLPLIFAGSVMCMYGFMGKVARYWAAETAPVASDTFNYMAENTQEGVKTVSKAVAKGVAEGLAEARKEQTPPPGKD